MSEEVKKEIANAELSKVIETIEEKELKELSKKEEAKTESILSIAAPEPLPKSEYTETNIFITESDLFDCEVIFKKDGNKIYPENVDEEAFKKSNGKLGKLSFKCKYPSVKDLQVLLNVNKNPQNMTIQEMTILEISRLYVLIRSWNMAKPVSELSEVNANLLRAMCNRVQEKIGLDGLI